MAALSDYVRRKWLEEFFALEGTVDFDEAFDLRELRDRDLRRVPDERQEEV